MGARILINTYGSRGDIAPFLAIARGLQMRGHHVAVASDDVSRTSIESAGLEFQHVRRGVVYGHESPYSTLTYNISNSYDDLLVAVRRADLLITHQLAIAGPLVAAATGIPWVSVGLSPTAFASCERPLTFKTSTGGHSFTPSVYKLYLRHMNETEAGSRFLTKQAQRQRARNGLAAGKNVMFADHHSPHLVLAAFSPAFASPEEHWPPQTLVTGFPVDERSTGATLPRELDRFLKQGPPPLVFTLGSLSVFDDGSFLVNSIAATKLLGRRALLVGAASGNIYAGDPDVMNVDFAPYSEVLPRAAAMVHHGGVGTTAAALRAGCPMLALPGLGSCDVSENAARAAGLGVARLLTLDEYNAFTAAAELARLLSDPGYVERAAEVSRIIRAEDGVGSACDAIERYLSRVKGRRVRPTARPAGKPKTQPLSRGELPKLRAQRFRQRADGR